MKIVSDITIIDNTPRVKDPAIAKLLPKNLQREKVSFVLNGVNTAVSNGLARTICDELPVIAMFVPLSNILTTDPQHLEEMIAKRLRLIPLDQATPRDAVFSLDAINDSPVLRDVKSSEIKYKGKTLPFNETFTICTLAPGCMISIRDIVIHEDYGYVKKSGMHVVAYATESIPIDVKPFDMEAYYAKGRTITDDMTADDMAKYGTPTRLANPRQFRVGFCTNGTMPAKRIVIAACDEIIKRLQAVESKLDMITNGEIGYVLSLPGESDTIGNLYMRTIIDLYPEVDFVKYTVSRFERSVDITVRFPDFDIKTMFTETTEHLIGIYKKIKAAF